MLLGYYGGGCYTDLLPTSGEAKKKLDPNVESLKGKTTRKNPLDFAATFCQLLPIVTISNDVLLVNKMSSLH